MKRLTTILVSTAAIGLSVPACSEHNAAEMPEGGLAVDASNDTSNSDTSNSDTSNSDTSDTGQTSTPDNTSTVDNSTDVSDSVSSTEDGTMSDGGNSGSGATDLDAGVDDRTGELTDTFTLADADASDADAGSDASDASDAGDASSDAGDASDDAGFNLEPVDLGQAGNYVILAKAAISTTGTTAIIGDIAISPADATYITGFGLNAPPTTFSTSDLITGYVWAADYDVPTPDNLTTAVSDMESAYTDAAGRTLPDYIELGAGNIDGMILSPGLYKWGTGVSVPNNVTLEGASTGVWIFQIAQDLLLGNGASVTLSGQAQPENVFWQVAGQATLGTTSSFQGILLSQTLIEFNNGATMTGRALAQTAVTLNATAITSP